MDTKPKHGNTIFVSGYKIDEDILQKTFSSHGLIVDISMEKEKKYARFYFGIDDCISSYL